jgi:hypothetical protein
LPNKSKRAFGELLKQADQTFQTHRNYYYSMISELRPLARSELSLPQVGELYSRFIACGLAELEANFLLGDFSQWYYRHRLIVEQLKGVCGIGENDGRQITEPQISTHLQQGLRDRVSSLGLATGSELEELQNQSLVIRDFLAENLARVITADAEVRWVEQKGIKPDEYIRALRAAPDEGIVLIPHREPT